LLALFCSFLYLGSKLKDPATLTGGMHPDEQVTLCVHSVADGHGTGKNSREPVPISSPSNPRSLAESADGAMEGVEIAETHTRSQRPRVLIRM
jgi:hypothetical protein